MKRFYKSSIKQQLRLLSLVALVLFMILFIAIGSGMRTLLIRIGSEYTAVTAERLADQLEFDYHKIRKICLELGQKAILQQFVEQSAENKAQNIEDTQNLFVSYMDLDPDILDISIVSDNVHYSTLYSDATLDKIRAGTGGEIFSFVEIMEPDFISVRDERERKNQRMEMLVYAANSLTLPDEYGTLVVSLDIAHLRVEEEERLNSTYILAGNSGKYFSLNGDQGTAGELYRLSREKNLDWTGEERNGYYLELYPFKDMDSYLISALYLRENLAEFGKIHALLWGCVILAAVFAFLVFVLICRSVVMPLYRFSLAMKTLGENEISREEGIALKGCAEMEMVGSAFNKLLVELDGLNRKIFDNTMQLYEEKVQRQEAELAWMRSQIDPHFLYNTLEAIRQLALARNVPEIGQMAWDIGNIFRYSIKGSNIFPLEQELSIVRSYLRIQQMRFSDRLDVHIFIPDELRKLYVIKMLIQPLVENAVFHGIEPKKGRGILFVGARRELGGGGRGRAADDNSEG